ncbi:hypothetical protein GALMADRAFT_235700 [Galerina marginata CBS 339.88]|uniref:Manganese/iron superoxide dismutase C-terminal domain-containing protein n=1 Tax=Galerina marginata (strain CBS 339.88) TaxID=685588 RepID=A0A067TWX8_GALM3|nr:hypothetical protein GALMADRAFT_235700 [Galerina marginata CBS 339.88]
MASCLRLASSNLSRTSSVLSTLRSNLGRRSLHKRKELPYPVEGGLGNFLPPPALNTLLEYQDGLLERLNQEVRTDTKSELHSSVTQTVVTYSYQRDRTLAFNYAVLALNNSFFLEQLAPPPDEESGLPNHQGYISEDLFEKIRVHYGDLLRLKSTFSAAAMGMFTNGWVWMVTDNEGNLGVLHTLGPSTLLVRSRNNMNYQHGLVLGEPELHANSGDIPIRPLPSYSPNTPPGVTPSLPTSGVSGQSPTRVPFDPHARAIHASSVSHFDLGSPASIHGPEPRESEVRGSALPSMMSVGKTIFPLFCVPVYEHAWMSAGFGVWGKEAWLREFWSVLDWRKVSKAYRVAKEGGLSKPLTKI